MDARELKLEPTLCHGLVEAIVASLRSQADSQGVKLVVSQNSEDVVARTDRRVLSTIVIGLVSHAIARTLRGVVHISVLRSVAGGKKAVEISVAEIAAHREAAETRRPPDGSPGLGRNRDLAALLGGKISIHCKTGEGSTYVLRFPEL